jgi:hypothetical protein
MAKIVTTVIKGVKMLMKELGEICALAEWSVMHAAMPNSFHGHSQIIIKKISMTAWRCEL